MRKLHNERQIIFLGCLVFCSRRLKPGATKKTIWFEIYFMCLSIYIHFPWCVRKCPYCDFNSYAVTSDVDRDFYIYNLIRDFKKDLTKIDGRKITSIYLGGGTPSLFNAQQIEKLLNVIAEHCSLKNHLEITMEANPGTLPAEECGNLCSIGINRLSVGVQSFQNAKLKALGRIYRQSQVLRTLDIVAKNFNNFNLDLLFGLPQQTIKSALDDLQQALHFKPQHLSWYQLTIEEGSQFYVKPPMLPAAERIWQIQKSGQEFLVKHGFKQYEVSAYSKTHFQCQHNLNYWEFGDYLGIGAGAHSKLTLNGKIVRFHKLAKPQEYLTAKSFIAASEILGPKQLPFEFMLNALRLFKPIPLSSFEVKTGIKISAIAEKLAAAQKLGLLRVTPKNIITTSRGHNFLNDLLEIFM